MTSATAADIADLTHAFYEAAFDDRLWADAATALKRVLNASGCAIGLIADRSDAFVMLYGDCDPYYENLALGPLLPNPYLPAMARAPAGTVISQHELMSTAAFERSAFFNEWLLPQDDQGTMVIKTVQHGRQYGFVTVNRGRGQPAIDEADVALAQRISPILTRISDLRRRIGALRLGDEASAYDRLDIGVAVADEHGRLLHANEAAEAIFADPLSGLSVAGGKLDAGRQSAVLRRVIAGAMQPPDGRLGLGGNVNIGGAGGLALTVSPMRDGGLYGLPIGRAAMIFIQKLQPRLGIGAEATMRELFGLTGKEARVAANLTAGLSVAEIAAEMGISVVTARSHLANLFRKTETRQQSQLVSLLKSILPLRY